MSIGALLDQAANPGSHDINRVEVGTAVLPLLRAEFGTPAPAPGMQETLLGIRIQTDERMDPGEWRIVDVDGNVLASGTEVMP